MEITVNYYSIRKTFSSCDLAETYLLGQLELNASLKMLKRISYVFITYRTPLHQSPPYSPLLEGWNYRRYPPRLKTGLYTSAHRDYPFVYNKIDY